MSEWIQMVLSVFLGVVLTMAWCTLWFLIGKITKLEKEQ